MKFCELCEELLSPCDEPHSDWFICLNRDCQVYAIATKEESE
jgi:hypothetical protein